jgi:glutamate-1-semialdehyde 2,1-aminomutase
MEVQEAPRSIGVDPARVAALLEAEREAFISKRPRARALFERAKKSQLNGTPTYRLHHSPPPVPLTFARAQGCHLWDTDGHFYSDFSLSGSAALFGHCHPKIVAAIREQLDLGIISDWPGEDHVAVTEAMQEKFGLPYWQFCLSAADANRFALRLARAATNRQQILVFSEVYHGSLDETHAMATPDGIALPRGVIRNGFDLAESTRAVRFNDIEGVERALSDREVAAVLVEPAVTNHTSIVMPDPGFHGALRKLTRDTDTILIIDETQTIAAGPGGFTREFGLEPDMMTMGKWAAGGLPMGMYGMTEKVAVALRPYSGRVMGSTLAGGALSTHAMRVALTEVMTPENYKIMCRAASRYEQALRSLIAQYRLPWHVIRLGARVAFGFDPEPPRTAEQVRYPKEADARSQLRRAIWHFLANRGVLINIWDCTSVFCPFAEDSDVDLHIDAVRGAIKELAA